MSTAIAERETSLLEQIDATALLRTRPQREPDWRAEARALGKLADVFANAPQRLAQALAETAMEMTGARAAGISLDETGSTPPVFRWIATAGSYAGYQGGTMPRHFSPCGVVVDRNAPVLMRDMRRLYTYIDGALADDPREVLLLPFQHGGKAVGTVWVVQHDDQRGFDNEDLRMMQTLIRFAGAAVENAGLVRRLADANAEQQRELDARARQVAQLKRWFDIGSGLAAYVTGPEHSFLFANEPFLGLYRAAGLAARAGDHGVAIAGRGLVDLLDDVRRTGQPFAGRGLPLSDAHGHALLGGPTHLDLVLRPDVDAAGAVVGIFVNGYDCSERVRSVAELQEVDARKDRFLAVLAHEMRSPLGAIKLGVHVIKRAGDDAAKRASTAASIDRQVGLLASLISDMTDIAAVRSGKLALHRTLVPVQEIVSSVLETCDERLSAKDIQLAVNLPDQALVVDGDAVRLTQVLVNLVNNAIKYTPRGGHASLRALRQGHAVELSVTDSGIGLEASQIATVFDMYMQVPMDDRPADSGLGIGLALVRQLVELHGGRVEADSPGLGCGSTFTVRLPLHVPQPALRAVD